MGHQALPSPYPDLADARKRLDAWRRTRPDPRPIPEEFWSETVALCRSHPVARALSLNYYGLKRRCQNQEPSGFEGFSFVEMTPSNPKTTGFLPQNKQKRSAPCSQHLARLPKGHCPSRSRA
jgi:hypothetical protein